jgi:hypothetical protein
LCGRWISESGLPLLEASLIAAKWYLRELSGEDMPGIARDALELGHDGKDLRRLAGLSNPTRREVAATVEGALRELGVHTPITERDAAVWMAKRIASEIVEGRIEPYTGACRIWLWYAYYASELENWGDAVLGYETAKSDRIDQARQTIIQAAELLVARKS